mmetsp:Transcript_42180/g.103791  ORF Transcript_42180/g.103791 Transcript_42180/m.103791 type:complete len:220 (+) Transcript_42180:567-1226(+)
MLLVVVLDVKVGVASRVDIVDGDYAAAVGEHCAVDAIDKEAENVVKVRSDVLGVLLRGKDVGKGDSVVDGHEFKLKGCCVLGDHVGDGREVWVARAADSAREGALAVDVVDGGGIARAEDQAAVEANGVLSVEKEAKLGHEACGLQVGDGNGVVAHKGAHHVGLRVGHGREVGDADVGEGAGGQGEDEQRSVEWCGHGCGRSGLQLAECCVGSVRRARR